MQLKKLSDPLLLALYRRFSEENWAAEFITVEPGTISYFKEWLNNLPEPSEDYEKEMLALYHEHIEGLTRAGQGLK